MRVGALSQAVQFAFPEGSSLTTASPPGGIGSSFDASRYMALLTSQSLGHVLLTAADIPSTQEAMRAGGLKTFDGLVLVADHQASGKGTGRARVSRCSIAAACCKATAHWPRQH